MNPSSPRIWDAQQRLERTFSTRDDSFSTRDNTSIPSDSLADTQNMLFSCSALFTSSPNGFLCSLFPPFPVPPQIQPPSPQDASLQANFTRAALASMSSVAASGLENKLILSEINTLFINLGLSSLLVIAVVIIITQSSSPAAVALWLRQQSEWAAASAPPAAIIYASGRRLHSRPLRYMSPRQQQRVRPRQPESSASGSSSDSSSRRSSDSAVGANAPPVDWLSEADAIRWHFHIPPQPETAQPRR